MEFLGNLSIDALLEVGTAPWVFAAAFGVTVTLLIWGGVATSSLLLSPLRRRLQALREPAAGEDAPMVRPTRTGSSWWSWFEPKKGEERDEQASRLVQAGIRSPEALSILYVSRLLLAVLLPLALWFAHRTLHFEMLEGAGLTVGLLAAAGVGFLMPQYFLGKRIASRQSALMESLPDALDLLVACTEAGLSLNAAIERVAQQMPASQPDLAEELALVNVEIRAGVDRTMALRNLADRTGLDEIRGLVSLISHSMRLGTGVAGTLRIYAEEFRDRRMQRAEEMAATVGTQMIFPLVLFLFPSFFLIAVGPAILNVMRVLSSSTLPGT